MTVGAELLHPLLFGEFLSGVRRDVPNGEIEALSLAKPMSPSRIDFVVLSLSAPGHRSRGTPTAGGSIARVCPQKTVSSTFVRCSVPFQCRLSASPASRTATRY